MKTRKNNKPAATLKKLAIQYLNDPHEICIVSLNHQFRAAK
jgi:hypothetical protein